ncbi:MAG: hypothetical protein AAF587_14635 [Bacteroidota bacterium]
MMILCTGGMTAQVPYTGGKGDGYAKARLTHVQVSIEESKATSLKIFPQLVRQGDPVTVQFGTPTEHPVEVEVFSLEGQLVRSYQLEKGIRSFHLSTEELSPTMYILRVLDKLPSSLSQKILIQTP